MVNATIDYGVEQSQRIDFGDSLNSKQLRINLALILGTLLAAAGAFAMQNQDDMKIWFDRNFALNHEVFWPQDTYLVMKGNNLRGEQVLVKDKIRIARDDDWTLSVFVTPESSVVPKDVYIDIRTGNSRSTVKMERVGVNVVAGVGLGPIDAKSDHAEEPNDEDQPKTDPPTDETDDSGVEAPDVEAPDVEAPDVEAPDAEAPDAEAPDAEAPDAEAPDAEAPDAEAPDAEAPDADDADADDADAAKEAIDPKESTDSEQSNEVDQEPEYLAEFTFTFHRRTEDFRFRVRGNDHKSDWVEVELVDRPSVSDLRVDITAPEYTGLGTEPLPSGRGPHYVLAGSSMRLTGESNKPLESGELTITANKDGFTRSLAVDGKAFSVSLSTEEMLPGTYEISLGDQEGLTSPRPTTFEIRLREDRVPRVYAKLRGVTGMVVSNARIPISCRLVDDFQITAARLSYQWNGDDNDTTGGDDEVALNAEKLATEIEDGNARIEFDEVWDLEPLDLPTGIALRFRIKADDNDAVSTGKPSGESSEFLLRIVTSEELRIDLLRRRKEIREEFERIRKEQDGLLLDTEALQAELVGQPDFGQREKAELMRIQRHQKVVGTNVGNIQVRLEKIVEEVRNNRLDEKPNVKKTDPPRDEAEDGEDTECDDAPENDTPEDGALPEVDADDGPTEEDLGEKLTKQIVPLLRSISEKEVVSAVRYLDESRAAEAAEVRDERLNNVATQQRLILTEMDKVLAIMVKVEDYQEALNLLYEIEKEEKGVLELTKEAKEEDDAKIFGDKRKKKPETEDTDNDSKPRTDGATPEPNETAPETLE